MTPKDSAQDQELLERYRRASEAHALAPSEAVRSAILAEGRRVAEQLAARAAPTPFEVSRPAGNDSRWKITAFGTAGAALLAALLIAPRYWESPPSAQVSSVPAAPAPKSESVAPLAETRARQRSKLVQNYAPAPTSRALQPAPAVGGARSMRADQALVEQRALTPASLQSAAASGDLIRTTLLLDQGAPVDGRDPLGRTPLMAAVMQDRPEVVRLLLARGADPNAVDNAGRTPLQQAKNKDLREIAVILKGAGAH